MCVESLKPGTPSDLLIAKRRCSVESHLLRLSDDA